jgi:hypothetical protein
VFGRRRTAADRGATRHLEMPPTPTKIWRAINDGAWVM